MSPSKKPKKTFKTSNPEWSKAMLAARSSNVAVPHADRRDRRARTRKTRIARELRDEG